ncbi:MAG: sulfatase [Acidobacteria bacterium]|nr:sulfatase [Acidobacteriota bacterium]
MLSRRGFLRAAAALPALAQSSPRKHNVLFIAIDDLKPAIGAYGDTNAITPNIDRLAARGLTLTRAYCQQAVCSPTRTSLLLGRRPDTTKIYDLQHHFRGTLPDVVTLPQHFKNHGYVTAGLSKIWHGGLEDGRSYTISHWTPTSPGSWGSVENATWQSRREAGVIAAGWQTPPAQQNAQKKKRNAANRSHVWESPDVADEELADGQTAVQATRALAQLKNERFFLMVGFLKPHLPFIAPKRYFDLHQPEKFKLAPFRKPPAGSPDFALHTNGELRTYKGVPEDGPIPEKLQHELLHAYYASASYTDAQIGKVLAALDANGLRDNTIVVLWGDHGWHLGDHGLWHKHTNFEQATRVPLILSVPGAKTAGRKSAGFTEFVDIYPTLTELCGLPPSPGMEGVSFAPLVDNPDRPWKKAAFSQYPRNTLMGYSMRTDRYRLTLWKDRQTGKEEAAELFDYEKDPHEQSNLANSPAYSQTLQDLRAQFNAGWRGALPR